MLPASIHTRGQLIYLTIKTWQARKLDKKATRKITEESNATGNSARVNKYLMADENADHHLNSIAKIARKTRAIVDSKTVPWNDAGMRLVSNIATFELLGDLRDCEIEFQAAVEAFLTEYPVYREASLQALGDMANEEDYPPVEKIRDKFSMRTALEPIAPGFTDDRTGLTDDERKMIDDHYKAILDDRLADANDQLRSRLIENLERYVDRLTITPDGKNKTFTHTMVDNLRETVVLFESLGMFDNAEMAKIKQTLETKVCNHEVKDLRDSIQAAAEARINATAVLHSLSSGSTVSTASSVATAPLPCAPTAAPSVSPAGSNACLIQPAPLPAP